MAATTYRTILAVIVCAGAAASLRAQEAAPVNLLPNGDFEKGAAGDASRGKLPSDWAKPYGDPAALQIAEEVRPGSEGDKCLKIGDAGKAATSGCMSQQIPIDARKPLKITGWVRDGGDVKGKARPFIGIAWYDARKQPIVTVPGTKVNYVYVNIRKMPDWQFFSHLLVPVPEGGAHERYKTVPPDAAFVEVRLFVINYEGPVWFDDVTLTQDIPDTGEKP